MNQPVANGNSRAFEPWMISNIALGAGFSAFVALLIPPYITSATGNPVDAGVVMAMISLAAVLAPAIGGFADKYRAHRLALTLGILGMALAFAMFAVSAETTSFYALDAILMGVSIAALSAVAPVFIVGARLGQALEAKRLTVFNLIAPVGQVLGGMLLGAAAAAGWNYDKRFWLAAVVLGVLGVFTWFTSGKPAQRIITAQESAEDESTGDQKSTGLSQVLFSMFGVYLLVLILSSTASNGVNNQIANILPNVYGIDEVTTSALISLAGLFNIVLFVAAGWWMGRSGAMPVFFMGNLLRMIGALGMALLGMATGSSILLVAASMQLLYQGMPFVRLAQPVIAMRFATISAGAASGWVIGASAIGSFIGSVLGGVLADKVGFNAINWMAAVAAGLAVALTAIVLWPANKRVGASDASAE